MSFDPKTGHFVLTTSDARLTFEIEDDDTASIAARLKQCGIEVHEVCPAWVRCDMRPQSIWEAFHGKLPDPSMIAHYWTLTARKVHPKWAKEELRSCPQAMLVEAEHIC